MGLLEIESRKQTRRNELRKIVLETIKVAGILSTALIAPNVLGAMVKIGLIASPRQKNVVERACTRMLSKGLLRREGKYLRLTEKGEAALRTLALRDYRLSKPPRWDGKWRIIIFDIPEYRATVRKKVRQTLIAIGFVRLQNSVWVYPYDCEDLMTLLKADFRVGKDILYLVVDALENDSRLRTYFELPRSRI